MPPDGSRDEWQHGLSPFIWAAGGGHLEYHGLHQVLQGDTFQTLERRPAAALVFLLGANDAWSLRACFRHKWSMPIVGQSHC